jgi:putative transposase
MKKSKYSEQQIIRILKEAEADVPVADLCRTHRISQSTLYRWKAHYSGLDVSALRQLRALAAENRRLKQLYADLRTAALLMAEAETLGHGWRLAPLERLTMRPLRRWIMPGRTARVHRNEPRRLTSRQRHHAPGSTSQISPDTPGLPALLTRSVSGPSFCSTFAITRSTPA